MSKQWYVYKDQQQKGPFTWEQLWQQARSGAVGPADQYWTEGMAGWTRGDQLTDLFPKPAAPPPPPPPPAAVPPPHAAVPPPAAAPPPAARPSGPTGPFQPGASGPPTGFPAKKKGKGGIIAATIILLLVLLGGGAFVYNYLLGDDNGNGGPVQATAGTSELIGAWYGEDDFGDEGYLKFNTDGTMHIASPWEGSWTTVDYRIEEIGGTYYLEVYDTYFEEWEQFSEMKVISNDRLELTDSYDGYTVLLERISERQFQEVISELEYMDWW